MSKFSQLIQEATGMTHAEAAKRARIGRPCNANDLITTGSGLQCTNCFAVTKDHGKTWQSPSNTDEALNEADAGEGAGTDLAEDGQPREQFYVPTVMNQRDVIANILEKFSKGGITYKFSHDDLILVLSIYSRELNHVEDDMLQQIDDVVKFLKDEYKGTTGKALNIGKIEHQDFNVVSNYTTNRLALCTLTVIYELPDLEATVGDETALEKGDIRGEKNILTDILLHIKSKNK